LLLVVGIGACSTQERCSIACALQQTCQECLKPTLPTATRPLLLLLLLDLLLLLLLDLLLLLLLLLLEGHKVLQHSLLAAQVGVLRPLIAPRLPRLLLLLLPRHVPPILHVPFILPVSSLP
jgi:hypothetical protein